jgi:hypothetical protein
VTATATANSALALLSNSHKQPNQIRAVYGVISYYAQTQVWVVAPPTPPTNTKLYNQNSDQEYVEQNQIPAVLFFEIKEYQPLVDYLIHKINFEFIRIKKM